MNLSLHCKKYVNYINNMCNHTICSENSIINRYKIVFLEKLIFSSLIV